MYQAHLLETDLGATSSINRGIPIVPKYGLLFYHWSGQILVIGLLIKRHQVYRNENISLRV